mgnify:CR=1 FL=1
MKQTLPIIQNILKAYVKKLFEIDVETDDEFYASLPDDRLLELDNAKSAQIQNVYVLDRLAKLDKSRLTTHQLELLQAVYRQHIVMQILKQRLQQLKLQCHQTSQ